MNRTRLLLLVTVLAATPREAAADDQFRVGNPQPALALGIGGSIGLGSIASGGGLHLEALTRVFPETMAGIEADAHLVGTSDPDAPQAAGRSMRAGAKLRHSIIGWGPLSMGGELAAVLGLGWEQIDWNRGGRLRSTQLVIGIEDGLVLYRRHNGRDRYAGVAFSARGVFSHAIRDCDGPCMEDASGWRGGVMLDLIVRASP